MDSPHNKELTEFPPQHHHDEHHHHGHEHHHHDEELIDEGIESHDEHDEEEAFRLDSDTLKQIYMEKQKPVWKEPDFIKLIIMIIMVLFMFLGEINVGIIAGSLTLLADSFHMLSDGISLLVGAACIWLAKKQATQHMTYGYGRAETLGGLINAVFLVSVVLYVMMESIQRFFIPERIEDPVLVLCVGGAGLAVNLIGLIMFCGHHPHPGHDHDHDHGHKHEHKHHDEHDHAEHEHDHAEHDHHHDEHKHDEHDHGKKKHKHRSENIFGVFLHVLGDFLGSIAVMISAGLLMIFDKEDENGKHTVQWVMYVDPALSLIMSGIILVTAIPLLKSTSRTLLQSVPEKVKVEVLKEKITQIEGVLSVHELHVWQFVGTKTIATIHIVTPLTGSSYMKMARKIQKLFHAHDIHSSTIQPEFVGGNQEENQNCRMICNKTCYEQFCCAPDVGPLDAEDASNKV